MLILTPSDHSLAPAEGHTSPLTWVRSTDGQQALDHGSCAASLLPADAEVVLVVPVRALSWHRLAVPKVAASRLRAALDGLLEERVLGETAELHFALEPGARSGQTLWVAACEKAWLLGWLQGLESVGRPVTRIVPALSPLDPAQPGLHWAHAVEGNAWLASAFPEGVQCLPLELASAALSPGSADGARWLADPSVAEQAERTLDQRFEPVPLHGWLLRCAQSGWNLAQFDLSLSSSARRGQRLRQALRAFRSSAAWRPARWGLAALVVGQLLGLNTVAWQERSRLDAKRQAVRQTLQQSFPNVTLVLDAPLQMQREVARLQQSSGQLSTRDLEAMLSALGQAGPALATRRLGYSPGDLQIEAPETSLRALKQALPDSAWQTSIEGGTLRLRPQTP